MSIDVNVQNDLVIVTESSEDITVNVSNAAGPAGVGVPSGGSMGQVLKKLSGTNYDTYWALDAGGVPYSGATGDVNLGEFGLTAGQLTLDVSPTGTAAVGTTRWNDAIGSSETTLKGGSVILKNGVDLVARVVNKVSPNTTLTKAAYQAVRVSGAQGQRLAVALAQANNDLNSADTIGLVTETIATNQEGFIMTVGQMEGINTTGSLQGETWVDGDVLYLSPTTPGVITKVKPTGNGHIVVIGYVEYAHANNGKIYLKVMNGWELEELHNVDIVTPANNEALIYESATSLWKNKTIATALGYTPISGTGVTGQVAYWNGTNSQTGSALLNFNTTNNGNLLVGTTVNPGANGSGISIYGTLYPRLTFRNSNTGDTVGVGMEFYMVGTNMFYDIKGANNQTWTSNATDRMRLHGSTGNLQLGSLGTGDSGQRLQVYGDAFIKGSGATSATIALSVQDSIGTNLLRVRNDLNTALNYLRIGSSFNTSPYLFPFTTSEGTQDVNGTNLSIYNYSGSVSTIRGAFNFTGNNFTQTSGSQIFLTTRNNFTPTSGTATLDIFNINWTINQTGGANGITRGLYVNPTLTAAADWRSIEWSNNSGWGLFGAGTADNYLAGRLSIGTISQSQGLRIGRAPTAADSISNFVNVAISNTVTSVYRGFATSIGLSASGFTLPNLAHFEAIQDGAFTAGVVTNHYGFRVNALVSGTNIYAFHSNIASGTDRWNLYMNGTADNYLRGKLLINTTTVGTFDLDVNGTARVSGLVRGTDVFVVGGTDTTNTANTRFWASGGQAQTSGLVRSFFTDISFVPSSGTAEWSGFNVRATINQTGGANGITRGIYIQPTLTAAADWRSIEWSNNTGWGLYGAGTAPNYLGGTLTASSFIKSGGTSSQILAADGSVITAGTNITISGGTISASGGGGGTTIYTGDGTLTGNRIVTMGTYTLTFEKDVTVNTLIIGKGGGNVATNTAVGNQALLSNTTGVANTAFGKDTLVFNLSGGNNSAFGRSALLFNTSNQNSAFGSSSMFSNTSGQQNSAFGDNSMYSNVNGVLNNAFGRNSLYNNIAGSYNCSFGNASLESNNGNRNSAFGQSALFSNTTGGFNVAIGNGAGYGTGVNVNTTGGNNIFIGNESVGESSTESNRTWIGNTNTTSTWVGGNLLVGIRTNAGYKLDVNGTARIQNKVNYAPIATPGTANAGDVYYDSSTNKLRCYNGTTWNDLF